MKSVKIQATQFFELLKLKDQSMWEIFAQMIDGEPKEIIFVDEEDKFLFAYQLPASLEEMQKDKELFVEKYAEKLMMNN